MKNSKHTPPVFRDVTDRKFTVTKRKRPLIVLTASLLLIAVIIGACAVYVSDYYRADREAIDAFGADLGVAVSSPFDGAIAYGNTSADNGFIFYPGGKVEYTSYEPLMRLLASKGILCILLKMPFNLAVLDMNAADGICELYPSVKNWYIGGHSLGGSMAASYASKHPEQFDGLILLASYSTADISNTSVSTLSVFGSEDKVMNREKYSKYKSNLPTDLIETEIEGGCHAYFGMYGEQSGDGKASITPEEQISKTSDAIYSFIKSV